MEAGESSCSLITKTSHHIGGKAREVSPHGAKARKVGHDTRYGAWVWEWVEGLGGAGRHHAAST